MFFCRTMTDFGVSIRIVGTRSVATVLLLLLMAETPAAAYTDPGSGAMLWQILVAGFVGVMFYGRKFTKWFRSKTRI